MMQYIFDTWPQELKKWGPKLRQFALDKYDVVRFARTYVDLMDQVERRYWVGKSYKTHTLERVEEFFRALSPGRYRLRELTRKLRSSTGLSTQAMPTIRVLREVAVRGGRFQTAVGEVEVLWQV